MTIKRTITALSILQPRRYSKPLEQNLEIKEDVLFKIRKVTGKQNQFLHEYCKNTCFWKWHNYFLISIGVVFLVYGIVTLFFTPLQMLLSFRLEMIPGMPPFEMWLTPPISLIIKVNIFNITNCDQFLNGTDKKMNVEEIGPVVYREILVQSNPVFNKNGTLSYSTRRHLELATDLNKIDLNSTICAPNLSVLIMAAYFHDSSFILKLGLNLLMKTYSAQPVIKTTIYNYLWNVQDPILDPAQQLMPHLVPSKNTGLLHILYLDNKDNATVFIGNKHGNSKFFTIDTYDNSKYLPHLSYPGCEQKFRNATEGLIFPQMLTKDANITFWRKAICRQADIRFTKERSRYGINAYHFELVPWIFDRVEWEGNKDCFVGSPPLPNGLADISQCYWGFPLTVSFPHFLYADHLVNKYVNGLKPQVDLHNSYTLIEPITGVPFEGRARCQLNLRMNKMWGFRANIQRFHDTIIPLAWVECYFDGVPFVVRFLVYTMAVILPICQYPLSVCSILLGLICIVVFMLKLQKHPHIRHSFEESEALMEESEELAGFLNASHD